MSSEFTAFGENLVWDHRRYGLRVTECGVLLDASHGKGRYNAALSLLIKASAHMRSIDDEIVRGSSIM